MLAKAFKKIAKQGDCLTAEDVGYLLDEHYDECLNLPVLLTYRVGRADVERRALTTLKDLGVLQYAIDVVSWHDRADQDLSIPGRFYENWEKLGYVRKERLGGD